MSRPRLQNGMGVVEARNLLERILYQEDHVFVAKANVRAATTTSAPAFARPLAGAGCYSHFASE